MYVITILANPERRNLDAALVDSIRNAWGGGEACWLAPDEAVEFRVPMRPDTLWQTWETCQSMQADLVLQPAEGRQKKMLLADMDSTLIHQECIDELAIEAGVGDRVADITTRAMNGEIDFEAALLERVGLLRDLPLNVITKVIETRITFMQGGAELVATMRANGGYAALVSGGFTAFTSHVAGVLGFDEHRANRLVIVGSQLAGTVEMPILGRQAKVDALNEISARLELSALDVMAVGDGANDLGMLDLAGTGVALHAKPSVAAQCDIRINHGDLTALLYLQGYSKDEFVSD